jgi:hypothetical protein
MVCTGGVYDMKGPTASFPQRWLVVTANNGDGALTLRVDEECEYWKRYGVPDGATKRHQVVLSVAMDYVFRKVLLRYFLVPLCSIFIMMSTYASASCPPLSTLDDPALGPRAAIPRFAAGLFFTVRSSSPHVAEVTCVCWEAGAVTVHRRRRMSRTTA